MMFCEYIDSLLLFTMFACVCDDNVQRFTQLLKRSATSASMNVVPSGTSRLQVMF